MNELRGMNYPSKSSLSSSVAKSSAATSAQRGRGSGQADASASAHSTVARSGGPDDRAPSAGWSAELSHQAGEGDSRHLPNLSTVVEADSEEHLPEAVDGDARSQRVATAHQPVRQP